MELVQNVGAGALARTIAQMAIHPLDTIKTRLQVSSNVKNLQSWQSAVAASCRRVRMGGLHLQLCNYAGPFGIGDLYLGLAGAVLGTLPAAFLFFSVDEGMKRMLSTHFNKDRRDMVAHMVSASTAAVASALVRVPSDVLKHRVQAYVFTDVWQAAASVWQKQGLRGLYCGFGATLLRDVPEMTIQFSVYEALRKAGEQHPGQTAMSHPMLLGGVAGATAAVFTTPLDVVKTQLQCQGACGTPMAALQHVLSTRGPAGFVAGMGPRVLQTTLLSAIFFTCYDAFKRRLAQHRAVAAASSAPRHHQLHLMHAQQAAAVATITRGSTHASSSCWRQRKGQQLLIDTAEQL